MHMASVSLPSTLDLCCLSRVVNHIMCDARSEVAFDAGVGSTTSKYGAVSRMLPSHNNEHGRYMKSYSNLSIPYVLRAFQDPGTSGADGEEEAGGISTLQVMSLDPSLVNVVYLTGYLGCDVSVTSIASGALVGKTQLAVHRKEGGGNTDWFTLEFWEAAAENAAQHLRKGSLVCVKGRVKVSEWTDSAGRSRIFTKIVCSEVSLISRQSGQAAARDSISPTPSSSSTFPSDGSIVRFAPARPFTPMGGGQPSQRQQSQAAGAAAPAAELVDGRGYSLNQNEELWTEFFSNPSAFWDNRKKKPPGAPDFKHKSTGEGLWVDSSTPTWAKLSLAELSDS
eukprot:TRINITY_DN389_c1_g2_i1.p1 TRINITY_DN389_c1_g2~~TRINITY_DN389_c1_g2_i1.p1  ORF type:complete len:338 (-),score=68.02 TRINITY_DN389_c1_g2_i1:6-1019(-)